MDGRTRVVAIECDYKELDRQLKEQSIYGPNGSGVLAEMFSELTKTDEDMQVSSKQVSVWAKRVDPQRAQAAVINSLSEVKDCGKIHARKSKQDVPSATS